jgi:ATP-dependent Zn protease
MVAKRGTTMEKVRDSIVGYEQEKQDLHSISEAFRSGSKSCPSGLLLLGNKGSGRHLFALTLAKESGAKVFTLKAPSDSLAVFAQHLLALAKKAKKEKRAVILLEDLETLLPLPQKGSEGSNPFCAALESIFEDKEKSSSMMLIGLGALNTVVPSILLGAGGFEKKIILPLPNEEQRAVILRHYFETSGWRFQLDFTEASRELEGLSAGDLKQLVILAEKVHDKDNQTPLTIHDLHLATHLLFKESLDSKNQPEIHDFLLTREVGFLVAGHYLLQENGDLQLDLYGDSLGSRFYEEHYTYEEEVKRRYIDYDEDDDYYLTHYDEKDRVRHPAMHHPSFYLDLICVLLSGRAEEEINYGEPLTGHGQNLEDVLSIARGLLRGGYAGFAYLDFGLSDAHLTPSASLGQDEEKIVEILKEQYQRALHLLKEKAPLVAELRKAIGGRVIFPSEESEPIFASYEQGVVHK